MPVAWNLRAPNVSDGASLRWQVSARAADGKATDKITVSQQIIPAVPVEIWAGALLRVTADTGIPVAPPAGADGGAERTRRTQPSTS